MHGLSRLIPAGPRRRLSSWLRRRGFQPDARYRIVLEYPTSACNTPRWDPHPELERIIAAGDATYRQSLEAIGRYRDSLDPSMLSEWLPPLDAAALYAFIRSRQPAIYLEIGSGSSTEFASRARRDGQLGTRIVSIDPAPRADIDVHCDNVVRQPLETADPSIFDELSEGDVVFFDGSHRTFMNSDATVFFLELLPRLAKGVLVGVHDVFLPYDYPSTFAGRYYSEQYELAAHLIAGNPAIELVLPVFYASRHRKLARLTDSVWRAGVEPSGSSFWLRTVGSGR